MILYRFQTQAFCLLLLHYRTNFEICERYSFLTVVFTDHILAQCFHSFRCVVFTRYLAMQASVTNVLIYLYGGENNYKLIPFT